MAGCRPDVGAGAQGVAHDEEDRDKRQPQGQHCAQHLGSRPTHSRLHAYVQSSQRCFAADLRQLSAHVSGSPTHNCLGAWFRSASPGVVLR